MALESNIRPDPSWKKQETEDPPRPPASGAGERRGGATARHGPRRGARVASRLPTQFTFGGWAWERPDAAAVVRAGFQMFEVGYPDSATPDDYARMRDGGVIPIAYVNMSEVTDDLMGPSGYQGPILRTNGDWGTKLVDVTRKDWQDWLVRRACFAFERGARGIKWDCATPDVPPGKTMADVIAAQKSVLDRIDAATNGGTRHVLNQGFAFAKAHPELVDAIETEGLFSARSYPQAYLKPWEDPWYWGPQYESMKKLLEEHGIPMIVAEYADPFGREAEQLYDAIVRAGMIPYVTSDRWTLKGRGYNLPAGWRTPAPRPPGWDPWGAPAPAPQPEPQPPQPPGPVQQGSGTFYRLPDWMGIHGYIVNKNAADPTAPYADPGFLLPGGLTVAQANELIRQGIGPGQGTPSLPVVPRVDTSRQPAEWWRPVVPTVLREETRAGGWQILPGLYQTSKPLQGSGPALARRGIQHVIDMDKEMGPVDLGGGVQYEHCAVYDSMPGHEEWLRIHRAADRVAQLLAERKTVAVSCQSGGNRSGVVNALALVRLGWAPAAALNLVHHVTGGLAGTNRWFIQGVLTGNPWSV